MKVLILIFLLLIPKVTYTEEPLLVKLSTEHRLQPIFVIPFIDQGSGFTPNYIQQLEQVLQFDLGHSGYLQLLPQTAERLALASSKTLNDSGAAKQWKALNARYVVKITLSADKVLAKVLLIHDNALKSIEGAALTGNLSQDRTHIHQLSDALISMLFDVQGIASTHLLYTLKYQDSISKKWLSEVWECDYDGANPRQILNANNGYCVSPVYIPAKKGFQTSTFFYVSYKIGQPKIHIGSLTTGNTQRLLNLRGNQLMPAISPQRDQIAFISDITGNPDLFLQAFSPEQGPIGKPRQIFTAHQATQGSPTFSPDGQRIAFVSNKDGCARIYVIAIPRPNIKLNQIKPQLISRTNRESTAPSWSPDGKKLAYCARNPGGIRQIWIYDFQSNQEYQLSQGPSNKENPSWAPDSLHLVFNTREIGDCNLHLINLNQPNGVKIADFPKGEKRFPHWEP
ncbi:MAG: Tol-Pal system protein TolB [Parachlamydiaceae bacterium]